MKCKRVLVDFIIVCSFVICVSSVIKLTTNLLSKNIADEDTALAAVPLTYSIQGKEYSMLIDTLDLNGRKNINCDTLVTELAQFANLKRVEVINTNLSYEQLDILQGLYPDIKFVFTITLANTWTIRTDVVAFSTNKAHHDPAIKNNEVWKLKYLTDVVALDIGHNEISDLSFLQYLPNLKILILADNWISDLSPITNCKKLMYLETFCNPIRDISPLAELDNLVDLNVSYNYFTDYTPLLNKSKLERLHITHTSLPMASLVKLKEAYPDIYMEYSCGTSVQGGWRTHPRYYAMREMFMTNTVNELFADSTDELENELTDINETQE